MVYIELKDKTPDNINAQNKILSKYVRDYRFYSEKDVKKEYRAFKADNSNYPLHQFPVDKIKSYDDFKKYWNTENIGRVFCPEFGTLIFDPYYSRTDVRIMNKISKYILNNIDAIGKVSGSYSTFIERCQDITKDQEKILLALEDKTEPKKLPVEQRTKKNLQGGQWLCKSFSPDPFWVIYGNVDSPRFMVDRQYEDDLYNNLYRDNKNRAYLLMPLMPIDAKTDWFYKHFEHAWNMGLREHPNFILSILYNVSVVDDIDDLVSSFVEFYTHDELKTRFKELYFSMDRQVKYGNLHGFHWNKKEDKFKDISNTTIIGKCQVLTALYKACGEDNFVNLLK